MKFLHIASLLLSLCSVTPSTHGSHIVSGSNSRLPQSLSTVIKDLEAEGANSITTVAFLSSNGVTSESRATLLRKLFGVTGEGDHDEEVQDGTTTAFGKKMGEETADDSDIDEESKPEEDLAEEEEVNESVAIAVANPFSSASVEEVTATVEACGGNVVFVTSVKDLTEGGEENLFEKLAPAMERILNSSNEESEEESSSKAIVVVIEGATTQEELVQAKSLFESSSQKFLSTIVQPDPSSRATTLQDVFDTVEFVSCSMDGTTIDEILADVGASCDPTTAASNVCKAVFKDSTKNTGLDLSKELDVRAAQVLMPVKRDLEQKCLAQIQEKTVNEADGSVQLNLDFGTISDAAVKYTLEEFDQACTFQIATTAAADDDEASEESSTEPLLQILLQSPIAKRIRSDLVEELYVEIEELYSEQMDQLYRASMESFKSSLSKLRLSPNLPSDMQKCADEAVTSFVSNSKKLRPKSNPAMTKSWSYSSPTSQKSKLQKELAEFVTLRIQTARADGKFKPIPRAGVTLGFHWLLPKPFGNDYRLEPWNVHTKENMVYIPKDKVTDVDRESVLNGGDWRDGVVPAPTASEMMYMK